LGFLAADGGGGVVELLREPVDHAGVTDLAGRVEGGCLLLDALGQVAWRPPGGKGEGEDPLRRREQPAEAGAFGELFVPVDRVAILSHLAVAPDRRLVDLIACEAVRSPLVQVRLRGVAQGSARSDCRLGHAAPLPHAAVLPLLDTAFHIWYVPSERRYSR